jgi:hypothetical protein
LENKNYHLRVGGRLIYIYGIWFADLKIKKQGIQDLQVKNAALLGKWLFRILTRMEYDNPY